jgi:hypothetical protein
MGYRGGYNLKAVETDYAGFANRYEQGKKTAEAARENVRKERQEQIAALVEASDFQYTGIADIDNVYLAAAQKLRSSLMDVHRANQAGQMSRSDATRYQANFMSQAQKISRVAEFKQKQVADLQKAIDKGDASQLSMDLIKTDFMLPEGLQQTYVDKDGNVQMANRRMAVDLLGEENGVPQLSFLQATETIGPDGKVLRNFGSRTINETVSTEKPNYRQLTAEERSKEMITAVAKKPTLGVDETGQPVTNALFGMRLDLGSKLNAIDQYNPAEFDYFRNNTELMISSTSINDKLSILYSADARLLGQREMRSAEEIDKVYNQGGNGFLYDKDGNPLTLKSDPLIINLDENMKPYLTEDQENYVDAIIRSNFYNQIGITRDKLSGYITTGRNSNRTKQDKVVISGADFNYDANFKDMNTANPQTVKVAGTEGVGYMKQLLYEEQVLSSAARAGNVQAGQNEYDQYVMGGKTTAPSGSLDNTFGSVQTAHGFTVNGIDDYAKKNLNVISQGNREMNTAEGFVITVEKIGNERQVGLYLTGTVNIRNTKLAGAQGAVKNPAKPGGNSGGTAQASAEIKSDMANASNSNAISKRQTPQQARKLFLHLIKEDSNMRAWANSTVSPTTGQVFGENLKGADSIIEVLEAYYQTNSRSNQ